MIDGMGTIKLKYLYRDVTRHGQIRWHVRVPGQKPVRIDTKGEPGSKEFLDAYNAVMDITKPYKRIVRSKATPGTLRWLVEQYKNSADFMRLKSSTRRVRARLLERICQSPSKDKKRTAGDERAGSITSAHIQAGRDRRADKPEAANSFVKALRALFRWAKAAGHVESNPALDVPLFPSRTGGWRPWTVNEIRHFQDCYPLGTKERLALELMINTGFRRSDVVRLGRQHVRNGEIEIRPVKTPDIVVTIDLLEPLAKAIDATQCGDLTFLQTEFGRPYTGDGFGGWFRRKCNAIGITGSPHGLRKAAAEVAAENGASEMQLMSIFGWTSGKQAAHYTRSANRRKMGVEASSKLLRKDTA